MLNILNICVKATFHLSFFLISEVNFSKCYTKKALSRESTSVQSFIDKEDWLFDKLRFLTCFAIAATTSGLHYF